MSALIDLIISGCSVHPQARAKATKAFAWARVSTDMQEGKGLSIPEQLREIRAYAEKNGIEIAAEFSEAASAFQKKSRRAEFERMIRMANADREISAIIVHDLCRFSRDSVEAQLLLRDLRHSGSR